MFGYTGSSPSASFIWPHKSLAADLFAARVFAGYSSFPLYIKHKISSTVFLNSNLICNPTATCLSIVKLFCATLEKVCLYSNILIFSSVFEFSPTFLCFYMRYIENFVLF